MFSTVKLSVQYYCSLICKLFKFIRGVRNVPFILYSNLLKFSDQPCVHVSFVVRRQLLFFIICFLFSSEVQKLIIRLNDEKEVLVVSLYCVTVMRTRSQKSRSMMDYCILLLENK